MRMSTKDSKYITKCRKLIEENLNWLNDDSLNQSDFQYLCDLVFEKTQMQLSLSTIKRFWDSSYNKSFQISTLNALAKFLDYENWHQFKEKNYQEVVNKRKEHVQIKYITKPKKRVVTVFVIALLFIGSILTVFVIINDEKPDKLGNSVITNKLLFTSKKSVKEGVPNTIIFNYDVRSYETDSLCIQLSWNIKEREKIEKENQFYTSTYYYPGYHHAKLIVDEDIVKEHNVHITTKDWLTLVRYKPDDIIPTYIRNKEVISNGTMYASPYLLKQNNVDLTAGTFYVSYFNIKDFNGLEGDNFSFETKIKNSNLEPDLVCQNCFIFIYAEMGAIVLPISSRGCVSDINLLAGDIVISGKINDLSALGCDLNDWRIVSAEIVNKNIISIDDKQVYELKFNRSLGKIKGWHYFFKGCGAVGYLNLYDSTKTLVYQDDFKR